MTEPDRKSLAAPVGRGKRSLGGLLTEFAPAKINLSLAVKGRRRDGYHELSSLVAFASIGDELTLAPGNALELHVKGPFADAAGDIDANLVLKAARALGRRVPQLKLGAFSLDKLIPVAAGLGGGSADAAAALRLLARANGLSLEHLAIAEAAAETGSDVPVCLSGGCRMMGGRGDILGPMLRPPCFDLVLLNPGTALDTRKVFGAFAALPSKPHSREFEPPVGNGSHHDWIVAIAACGNDLEGPAIDLSPVIETAKGTLEEQPDCLLARMSGSGATVFGIFADTGAAQAAARHLAAAFPHWWVRATKLAS
jgi:4-diphosphocytidyl-2-C-methyl-D-erythritol kinase